MNINYLKPLSLLIGIIILCTACTDSEHDKTEANNNPEISVPALDSTNRTIPGNNLTVNDQNYDLRELKMIDEKTGWALTKFNDAPIADAEKLAYNDKKLAESFDVSNRSIFKL